jgi:hypothetical protein
MDNNNPASQAFMHHNLPDCQQVLAHMVPCAHARHLTDMRRAAVLYTRVHKGAGPHNATVLDDTTAEQHCATHTPLTGVGRPHIAPCWAYTQLELCQPSWTPPIRLTVSPGSDPAVAPAMASDRHSQA